MTNLTPFASLAGGILIGLAALVLLAGTGRIAGISGICGGFLVNDQGDRDWRAIFIGSMILTAVVIKLLVPEAIVVDVQGSIPMYVLGGVLVGAGTQLGSGCTSGHGVCGMGRRSPRSIAATLTFMLIGMVAVFLARSVA